MRHASRTRSDDSVCLLVLGLTQEWLPESAINDGKAECYMGCSCECWLQGSMRKDIDAYQSDPTKEKSGGRKSATYGPEMLETWLLLEFCDRCADCVRLLPMCLHHVSMHSMVGDTHNLQMHVHDKH